MFFNVVVVVVGFAQVTKEEDQAVRARRSPECRATAEAAAAAAAAAATTK
jgi:hypothetical protein